MTNQELAELLAGLGAISEDDVPELTAGLDEWIEQGLSNAQLARRISEYVSLVNGREQDISNWALGATNGGPNGDGIFPIRIQGGGEVLVPSPLKLTTSTQKGDPGGVRFNFSNNTEESDPGPGKFKMNDPAAVSVTKIYYDYLEANGGDVKTWLMSWGESSSAIKGSVTLQQGAAGAPLVFNVVDTPIDNGGYVEITVAHVSGAVMPDNNGGVISVFARTGDHGDSLKAGAGAPGAGFGANGDYYLRLDTGDFYGPKTAGAWGGPIPQTEVISLLAQTVAARNTATGAASTAVTNAGLTNADKIATAADRVQTGLDKVGTGNDKTQTGLDKTQTGLDRVQTALDRVNVDANRILAQTAAATATTKAGEASDSAEAAATSAASVDGPELVKAISRARRAVWFN